MGAAAPPMLGVESGSASDFSSAVYYVRASITQVRRTFTRAALPALPRMHMAIDNRRKRDSRFREAPGICYDAHLR